MPRVQVAAFAWGYVVDRRTGAPKVGAVHEIDTTVYAAATGATTISPADYKSDDEGLLPGFVEAGVYQQTDPDGDELQVEAYSGVDSGALGLYRPIVDAREYAVGFDLTGATDNSTQMQAAIDAAVVDGRRLYLPGGTIKAGSVLLKPGLHMVGDPGFGTRLILPALDFVGGIFGTGSGGVLVEDLVLEDLYLDGQQQSRSVSCGNALLKAYKAARWTLRRLKIANGTSYGFGWQGYPGDGDPDKEFISLDLLMEQCYVHDCGYIDGTPGIPRSGTSNSSDGIDIKSSERIVLNKVYSAYSSDPCFDIRSRRADLIGCVALGGGGAGFELASHRPNAGAGYPDNDSYLTVLGGMAKDNAGTGIVVSESTGESETHADLVGFHAIENAGSGFANNAPEAGGEIYLSISGGHYSGNDVDGIAPNAVKQLAVNGAVVRGNAGDGIDCTNQDGGTLTGNVARGNGGTGIKSTGTSDKLAVHGNDLRDNAAPISLTGTKNRAGKNVHDADAPSVASAATITLPDHSDLIVVTGTTTITNITRSYIGRRVTLVFAASLTLGNGGSLLLTDGNNVTVTENDVVEFVCLNVNYWVQCAPKGVN